MSSCPTDNAQILSKKSKAIYLGQAAKQKL